MPAVETAVLVVDAVNGMGTTTDRVMDFAGDRNLCRAIVINRIDAPGANCNAVLKAVTEGARKGNGRAQVSLDLGSYLGK